MTEIQILVGTTSGNTEYLADYAAKLITQSLKITVNIHYEPDLTIVDTTQPWLIFLASHGAGDYADSMLTFYDQLSDCKALNAIPYTVVAIGESCYDTYCQAGRDIDQRLEQLGANRIHQRLEIDMLEDDPENCFQQWLPEWIKSFRSYTQ